MIELHEVKKYPGNLAEDCADLPAGCKDIGQIQSGEEIMRGVFTDFRDIFGDGKLQRREQDFGGAYSGGLDK